MSDYEPDPQTAKLFARYKQAAEIIRTDKRAVLTAAEQAMRQGATSPELAALTGMSGQTFRTLAEKIGVDIRTKPPTVGAEAEARRAQAANEPTRRPLPPVTPLLGMSGPPPELGLSDVVKRQSVKAARILVKAAEREHPTWAAAAQAEFADVEPRWHFHALLQSAINEGHTEPPSG